MDHYNFILFQTLFILLQKEGGWTGLMMLNIGSMSFVNLVDPIFIFLKGLWKFHMSDRHKKQQESIKKVLMVLKGFEIKIYVKRKKKYPRITMIF